MFSLRIGPSNRISQPKTTSHTNQFQESPQDLCPGTNKAPQILIVCIYSSCSSSHRDHLSLSFINLNLQQQSAQILKKYRRSYWSKPIQLSHHHHHSSHTSEIVIAQGHAFLNKLLSTPNAGIRLHTCIGYISNPHFCTILPVLS